MAHQYSRVGFNSSVEVNEVNLSLSYGGVVPDVVHKNNLTKGVSFLGGVVVFISELYTWTKKLIFYAHPCCGPFLWTPQCGEAVWIPREGGNVEAPTEREREK